MGEKNGGGLEAEAAFVVFEFWGFAVEDDAEGVEGIIGGELVSLANDGVEDLVFGEGFAFDDFEDGVFEGHCVADATGGSAGSVV